MIQGFDIQNWIVDTLDMLDAYYQGRFVLVNDGGLEKFLWNAIRQ